MREYGTVRTQFWTDEKSAGWSTEGRLLAVYLIAGPHTTGVGCFRLPDGYIQSDLRWDAETVSRTVTELSRDGFIHRSRDGWTWIPRFLNHNPIANPNVGKSMVGVILAVPRNLPFYQRFIDSLETVSQRFPQGFLERVRAGMPNQEQEQEQEQEIFRSSSEASPADSSQRPTYGGSIEPAVVGKKRKAARATALVDAEYLAEMKAIYRPADVDRAWANMRAWLLSPKGRGKAASKLRLLTFLRDAEPIAQGSPAVAEKKERARAVPENWAGLYREVMGDDVPEGMNFERLPAHVQAAIFEAAGPQ